MASLRYKIYVCNFTSVLSSLVARSQSTLQFSSVVANLYWQVSTLERRGTHVGIEIYARKYISQLKQDFVSHEKGLIKVKFNTWRIPIAPHSELEGTM